MPLWRVKPESENIDLVVVEAVSGWETRLGFSKLSGAATKGWTFPGVLDRKKNPTSVARWISHGLRKQLGERSFRERIDDIDRRISGPARNNPNMP